MNHTYTNNTMDWPCIRHLLKLGLLAGFFVLAGDMLLGWGTVDNSLTGMEQFFSGYRDVSAGRLVWSAFLGMIGIPLEGLCYTAVYRMIRVKSRKCAHLYRTGIVGYLIFGGCGLHVPCCAMIWVYQQLAKTDAAAADLMMQYALYFLVPATILFMAAFFLLIVVQIYAFTKSLTPLPGWCWIFSLGFSMIAMVVLGCLGNYPFVNALSTGWISLGNIWMFGGLLAVTSANTPYTVL